MYLIDNMIDMGLRGSEWATAEHRIVAINVCICNPNVRTMECLADNIEIINAVPLKNIRTVTASQLVDKGCYF